MRSLALSFFIFSFSFSPTLPPAVVFGFSSEVGLFGGLGVGFCLQPLSRTGGPSRYLRSLNEKGRGQDMDWSDGELPDD